MKARRSQMLNSLIGHDAYWLRRLAYIGARYGSASFVRYGPVAIGVIFSGFLPGYRLTVRGNLRRIHGKRSAWQELRDVTRTFVTYACCLSESLGSERRGPNGVAYRILGREILDSVLAQPKGFIAATAHVGAWDSAARHLHQVTGRSILIVMSRESNFAARRYHDSIRQCQGVEILHVGENAFEGLRLLRHLREGGIVAVQLDRMPKYSRPLQVPLFGQYFEIPRGPFQLASLASVPIVPVFCARIGHFEYEIHVNMPIQVDRPVTGDQLSILAQDVANALEAFLRKYPTQWFHFRANGPVSN